MKCVVIGGSGFLGGAIIDYLVSKGDTVFSADRTPPTVRKEGVSYRSCNILDKDAVKNVVEGADEVYHTAGVLGTSELNGEIQNAVQVNVEGAVNVFEECVKAGVKRVFYPSKPNVWLNTYSITKEASEKFATLFNEKYDTNFISLRWFNAYGPGQHTHPVRKIIPTFCLLARFGLPINIFGSGFNVVDMMHSRDVGKWSVEATRNNLNERVYEFGRGVPLTVLEVAYDINRVAGNKSGVIHSPMRDGEDEDTYLVAKIGDLAIDLESKGVKLGFEPWMESLKETYDYYCSVPEEEAIAALKFHGLWKQS